MKREDAARVLGISGQTVVNWKNSGKIKAVKLESGHYDYDDETIYSLAAQTDTRMNITYCRASTERRDLEEQKRQLEMFCASNEWVVHENISEISSATVLDKRKNLMKLLELVEKNNVRRVIITDKNVLSRTSFDMLEKLFNLHGTEIVVAADSLKDTVSKSEILDEIVSLLACYGLVV